jgi:hypothetical protein
MKHKYYVVSLSVSRWVIMANFIPCLESYPFLQRLDKDAADALSSLYDFTYRESIEF